MAVVLVTGASSGIGRCCAEELARRGHRVYGGSRSGSSAPGVIALRMDVSKDIDVSEAVGQVLEREGRLDVVVNNAGIGIAGAIEDTSIEEAREQFEVNVWGAFRVIRAALPFMRKARSGVIVNIGSIGGLVAIPYQGVYSFGVRVVLVEPGDYRTGFTEHRRRTASSITNVVYREPFERSVARMSSDEQSGDGPDDVARLIARLIVVPRPRLRYTAGPAKERALIWVKRLGPYSVIERILLRYYGI
jgi:NAD(P)-dependent dehydrogenase (short-subunit alcohol dehydrogenase family)